jgi:hypothetical protein
VTGAAFFDPDCGSGFDNGQVSKAGGDIPM